VFRHALIQDAAYHSLLLSRRRQYHSEIAHALERRFPGTAESQPEIIARHYMAAAAPEQAIPYWVKAGERALARLVYVEPLAHFEQALELARGLPESPDQSRLVLRLLLLVSEARLRVLRLQEALESFTEAAELARVFGAHTDLAQAALGAEDAEIWMGIPAHRSAGLLEAALAVLDENDNTLRCRVLSHLGRAMFKLGAFDRATALMRDATDLARRLGDRRALSEALDCAHIATVGQPWAAQQFPARRASLDEMMAIVEEVSGDSPGLLLRSLALAMTAHLEMGDLEKREAGIAQYGALRQKAGLELSWVINSFSAMEAILHGDFSAAERFAEAALKAPVDVDDQVVTGVYGTQMFTIRREQGRLAEVAPLLRRFVAEKTRDSVWRPGFALITADLGFIQAAQKTFGEIAAERFNVPVDAKRNVTLSYLAEVCTRLADGERARQLYELLWPYRDLAVVAPVATVCCWSNARFLGMLASVMGDAVAAQAHFEAALEMDERLHAWPWLAHTKHEFALLLRDHGGPRDQDRADTLLAAASASAERFGMAALQAKIRSLAARS
jgi:tetratricopeptide (TPR) repeat protein